MLLLIPAAMLARKTHASQISYQRALQYLESNFNDRAIEEFQRAIASDHGFALAHHDLGVAYLRLERYEEASKAFQKYDEAIAAFQQALKLNPQQPNAQAELGAAYDAKGLYDQAFFAYAEALKLDPANEHVKESLQDLKTRTSAAATAHRQ